MTTREIRKALRLQATAAGSQAALARTIGCSASYLSDVLAGRRTPGPAMLTYLKLEASTDYRRRA